MKRILLVEDDADLRKLFCGLLDREGYHVETAGDGLEGLETLEWFRPNVLLLNIMMPRMDGLTMLKELRDRPLPNKPRVIMASACAQTSIFEQSLSLGAVDFLEYPLECQKLLRLLPDAFNPDLSDEQLALRARLRRVTERAQRLGCGPALDAAASLCLRELIRGVGRIRSMASHTALSVARRIVYLRGQGVMLDYDLAEIYGVPTKVLNRAVRRNRSSFYPDLIFQLTKTESDSLRCQIGTLKRGQHRKFLPYAFTREGHHVETASF